MYMLFLDVKSRRQVANDPAGEIPGPLLLKSDVNLFNHLVRKADVAGCCSAGSVLSLRGCPVFSVADLYCLKLFLRC